MSAFLYRLIPPRLSFPSDITPEEAELMRVHGQYWRKLLEQDALVVFGPVADPKGAYGIAVVIQPGDEEARELAAGDPGIKANVGFTFELHAMPQCVTKQRSA
jgi:uncharacterized protein YciI